MTPEELKKRPEVLNIYRSRAKLTKRGTELLGKCPFPSHKDDTPSFTVYQHEGVWLWKCFGCQGAGNIFQFIQRLDNCNFSRACEIVENLTGAADQERSEKVFQKRSVPAVTLSLSRYRKFEEALATNTFVQNWLLQERGITFDTAKKLHMGFVQTLDGMEIYRSGLEDVFDKGWICLPAIDGDEVTALEVRSIIRKEVRKVPGMKTDTLFGYHLIDPLSPVYLVEGGYDMAILVQSGFAACSVPGAEIKPTAEMLEKLELADYVVLAGDTDKPGIECMERFRVALKDRACGFQWAKPHKDASDVFLKELNRFSESFRTKVESLTAEAKSKPFKGIYSVQHSLMTGEHTKLIDHPDRFRFPWKSVDDMAIILPGTVTTVFSTDSGMGKSSWVFQATIHGAQKHKETVLNYQAELTSHQIDTIFTSHLLHKDRLNLDEQDYRNAAQILGPDFRYYIGRDTSLTSIDQVLDLIESGIKHFRPTVVVLDNLHFLCRGTGRDTYKEQATAMQRITNMAATYNLKFIVVHQARKADQQHKGKTNHISDLDGTKAVQNDSATVFSIHRDEVKHNKDLTTNDNEYSPITQIAVKKFRDKGPGGSYTTLMFAGKVCTFSEIINDIKTPANIEQPEESIF